MSPSRIAREIKQTRPFSSKLEEGAVALLRTADMLRRTMSTIFDPHDLTPQQYNVLRILRGAGDRGLPTLEIAERMVEQTPGITRLIDRLEAKTLVLRERCKTDRRQVFCRITAAGLELLAKLDASVGSSHVAVLGRLEDAELDRLLEVLDRTREAMNTMLTTPAAATAAQKPTTRRKS